MKNITFISNNEPLENILKHFKLSLRLLDHKDDPLGSLDFPCSNTGSIRDDR